ncbi:MAG: N-dimethylarginine dimethylaminohydrolase [Propionibacteriaceae bacterium]|jgi:N-dimethylarginine dimethylaminohydrolase|nr:N-dimethylarginine dimethylaminohydrolase [Propionibacteriaceae bacterium]
MLLTPERTCPQARTRRFLMVPPTEFTVNYEINPWMDKRKPVDTERAMAQWEALVAAYREHGHDVRLLEGMPGLPDMVFSANGGLSVDGIFYTALFTHPQRVAEAVWHAAWHQTHGSRVVQATQINEGEGDFAVVGERILAGHGFRTSLAAHAELADVTGREVVSLRLVNPSFYHLDTALTVLDETTVAYYPGAFDADSQETLARLYPTAIRVAEADAHHFALNSLSDGLHVFCAADAAGFIDQLAERGYAPVPLDLSEFRLAGGGIKCCTQELR